MLSSRATSTLLRPCAASNTIRERSASACALVRRRAQDSNWARSSAVNSIPTGAAIGMHPAYHAGTDLMHHDTRASFPNLGHTPAVTAPRGLMIEPPVLFVDYDPARS